MTPEKFIEKWKASTRTERSAAQEHFLDLCELVGGQKPADIDPHGEFFTFETDVTKADGGRGFADVWYKGRFAWEYKGPQKSLQKAYAQLKNYADALHNPPLLIVSDMAEIRIHTNFTNCVSVQHTIKLADLMSVEARQLLRHCFTDPQRLRPTATRESVTRQAAKAFGELAAKLRRSYDDRRVAHFLNRLVFCLFAEDIDLLPDRVFAEILEVAAKAPDKFPTMLTVLFRAMKDRGGMFGYTAIPWFNGGLFDDDDVLPLNLVEINDLVNAARLDWSAIEPSIFGTLFEAGLDPAKREVMASLFDPAAAKGKAAKAAAAEGKGVGIHYTDPATIMKIIEPVVLAPLRREWKAVKAEVARHRAARDKAKSDSARTRAENAARDAWHAFRQRLGRFRVLDPACGSGNFLYLALIHLKDFDKAVIAEARELGLPADDQRVTPAAVKGIEINPYAAELARVTIWIGELQWQLKNSFGLHREPILGRLDTIECRDALLTEDGREADWPEADVVVGNPPFLGDKLMIGKLGEEYVVVLRRTYSGRVPGGADLVTYWFAKAWDMIQAGRLTAAGLVSTNSIRGGANRKVLDRIVSEGVIFDAWGDEPWVVDGAAVRVSLVCLTWKGAGPIHFDGKKVDSIHANLTCDISLTSALRLAENAATSFIGTQQNGPFTIDAGTAREWLKQPANPNGLTNSVVVRPWTNGLAIVRKAKEEWIIDFGCELKVEEAALFEKPFERVRKVVKPLRDNVRRDIRRKNWWRLGEPMPALRRAIANRLRYIATPRISKHRIFVWLDKSILPDCQIVVIARDDDTTFGILHSRFHEAWALRLCTWLGVGNDPRYTPSTTFETFPFPDGLTPNIPAADYADDPRAIAIAAAARRLDELRRNWLNPPDLVKVVPEVVPGFPDRILPVSAKAEAELKKRTLTNLYNERPTWLDNAHRDLDAAVAAAYGWPADISDDEALARLLALNHARAAAQGTVPEPAEAEE